jgi:hypothetical protein
MPSFGEERTTCERVNSVLKGYTITEYTSDFTGSDLEPRTRGYFLDSRIFIRRKQYSLNTHFRT